MAEKRSALDYLGEVETTEPAAVFRAQQTFEELKANGRNPLNLGIGVAQSTEGNDIVFQSFREAERRVQTERQKHTSYIEAAHEFLEGMQKMIFAGRRDLYEGRTAMIDAHGGTNADYLSLLFWRKVLKGKAQFLVGHDSWSNFDGMVDELNLPDSNGNTDEALLVKYVLAESNLVPTLSGTAEVMEQSQKAGRVPVCIVQNGPHNGLGLYRDRQYWDEFFALVQKNGGVIHFDDPYPGMGAESMPMVTGAAGAMEYDRWPIRRAADLNIPFTLATTLSKTASQYDSRVGMALVNMPSDIPPHGVASVLQNENRAINSFTSKTHLTAAKVFSNPELKKLWLREYGENVLTSVFAGREALREASNERVAEVIERTRGMFVTVPMAHSEADKLLQDDPPLVVVKNTSLTLAPDQAQPIETIRINATGMPAAIRAEVAQRVMKNALMP